MVPTGRRFAPPDDRLRTRPGISRFRVRVHRAALARTRWTRPGMTDKISRSLSTDRPGRRPSFLVELPRFSPSGPLGMNVLKNLANSSDDFRDSIFRTRETQQVISSQNGPIRAQRFRRTHCGVGQLFIKFSQRNRIFRSNKKWTLRSCERQPLRRIGASRYLSCFRPSIAQEPGDGATVRRWPLNSNRTMPNIQHQARRLRDVFRNALSGLPCGYGIGGSSPS
jgi:hypothetical protein